MESTGVYTPIVKEKVEKTIWGAIQPAIFVINPSLLRKYPGEIHADRQDAFELARIGLLGLAEPSYLPVESLKELRWLSRRIFYITKDTARLKNRIKLNLDLWGLSLTHFNLNTGWALDLCKVFIFHARGNLKKVFQLIKQEKVDLKSRSKKAILRRKEKYERFFDIQIPDSAVRVIELQLANLNAQNAILKGITMEIEKIVNEHPSFKDKVQRLMEIPGLSSQSVISLVSEIGNISRFSNIKKFLQYVGCAPTIYQSGTIRKASHLNRRVNHFCKLVFMQAGRSVCSSVKKDSDLKEFARKQLNRHWKDKKLAYANTGIKIARIAYRLLLTGDQYLPFFESKTKREIEKRPRTALSKPFRLTIIRKRIRHHLNYLQSALEYQHEEVVEQVYDEIKSMWEEVIGTLS
jgi:transposase